MRIKLCETIVDFFNIYIFVTRYYFGITNQFYTIIKYFFELKNQNSNKYHDNL